MFLQEITGRVADRGHHGSLAGVGEAALVGLADWAAGAEACVAGQARSAPGTKAGVRRGAAGCQDRRRPGPACRKLQGACWVHVAMCSGAGARRNGLAGAIRRRGYPASADDTRLRRTSYSRFF
ncbi:hypothetical protein GQ55_1G417700 [Panicum hallii var. hallii]|uniref:Uncharacterized protein n=1 Tax=Panicum hallii var. hallii TaxID=1504633 RepID=A0A2T7FD32_9POAL|nr:hypothetical protein GQ55_1G417700 [Panicum hallii var. hallii]